jgi:hypothetical protein
MQRRLRSTANVGVGEATTTLQHGHDTFHKYAALFERQITC